MRFSISESLGGYHPGFAFRTLAFDRTSRQAITLDTLLIDPATALPKISALVRTDLQAQLGGVGAEFVDTGTVPEPGNFKDFAGRRRAAVLLRALSGGRIRRGAYAEPDSAIRAA